MSHPKEAWKFKAWSEAMLRGAMVGTPEYKAKGPGINKASTRPRRRKRRRKKTHATKKQG